VPATDRPDCTTGLRLLIILRAARTWHTTRRSLSERCTVSDLPPNQPGDPQPWGGPPPEGPQGGSWGAAPSGPPPPYGQQPPPYGQQPPPYGQQPPPYGQQPPPYGQQLPPYGQFGGPQSNWAPTDLPAGELATWGPRALGMLVDIVLVLIPSIVLGVIGAGLGSRAIEDLTYVVEIGMWIWFGTQVGQTGASPGMRTVGLKCVKQATGGPCGTGTGILRVVLNYISSFLCLIGALLNFLWPLWDQRRQTVADKIVGTVVLKVPAQGFSITPRPVQ